ncbi:DUF3883 domain-containing protein [Empedobacter falsenii]
MEPFFEINETTIIGWKQLSQSDLGLKKSGNQTHIGLFKKTLQFWDEGNNISSSKLIYKGQIFELLLILDFIKRKDGRIEAPKIRKGELEDLVIDGILYNSVTRKIWEIVRNINIDNNWYLVWYGLSSSEIVFYIIEENSDEFIGLKEIIKNLGKKTRGTISKSNKFFFKAIKFLESLIILNNIDFYKEIELIADCEKFSENTFNLSSSEINKAKLYFQQVGRKGEELIFKYFIGLKSQKEINNIKWLNEIEESYKPYDFEVVSNDGTIYYIDVKTTDFDFDQKLIVSTNEFNFINQNPINYHIYRVYNLNNNEPSLRICRNINQIGEHIINHTNQLTTNLSPFSTTIQSLKFAIQPNNHILNFDDPITL